jgi:hypothetical protein
MAEFAHEEDAKLFETEAANHEKRATYLTEHGIKAAGALLDVAERYYGQWAHYYDKWSVQLGQVLAGAIAGATGSDFSVPQPSKTPAAAGRDERAYQEQRAGERELYGTSREQPTYDYGDTDFGHTSTEREMGAAESYEGSFSIGGGGGGGSQQVGYM